MFVKYTGKLIAPMAYISLFGLQDVVSSKPFIQGKENSLVGIIIISFNF